MSDNRNVHLQVGEPYIKGYIRPPGPTLACNIDAELPSGEADKLVRATSITYVTCEWCKIALEKKREELVTQRQLDERIVNMRFNNAGLTQGRIERAVEMGVAQGLSQISNDFKEAKAPLGKLVEDAVEAALQRHTVRKNLVGIVKIADDEIESEYESGGEAVKDQESRFEDMKQAVREVLQEQAEAGVGTKVEFTQNVYSPSKLSSAEIYRQGRSLSEALATSRHHVAGPGIGEKVTFEQYVDEAFKLEPWQVDYINRYFGDVIESKSTTTVNVNAEVDPESFKQMVKDAISEDEEDTIDEYNENETALMQRAVASVVTSSEFQELLKKVVKVAIDEDEREHDKEYTDWHEALLNRVLDEREAEKQRLQIERNERELERYMSVMWSPWTRPVDKAVQLPEEPTVHYRKLYTTKTWCGAEGVSQVWRNAVTCQDCKDAGTLK